MSRSAIVCTTYAAQKLALRKLRAFQVAQIKDIPQQNVASGISALVWHSTTRRLCIHRIELDTYYVLYTVVSSRTVGRLQVVVLVVRTNESFNDRLWWHR